MDELIDLSRGLYTADRTSALAGVPRSTLHYWARHGIVIPGGASMPRTRLWTWGDLILLRIVHWLREPKPEAVRSTMAEVRETLEAMNARGLRVDELAHLVAVTRRGHVVLEFGDDHVERPSGQSVIPAMLPVIDRFGAHAPNLLNPGPGLRIIPGKLSGAPHIEGTRIPTLTVWELKRSGFSAEQVREMYPEAGFAAISAAWELEGSLVAA